MKIKHPALIGLAQALGVIIYIALLSQFMSSMGERMPETPEHFVMVIMMTILVFSAAITGSLVFGYPVYLAFNKHIKRGINVFAYTLAFLLAFVLLMTFTAVY